MATSTHPSSRANGKDSKAVAARAAKKEAKQELRTAQDAAGSFVSAVRSSAAHFGQHLGYKVAGAANKVQNVRHKAEDRVRERPLAALGIAAGLGLLLGILTRR